MNIELSLTKTLPSELIYLILEYGGYVTWRNGKYMFQLLENIDIKYSLIVERMRFQKYRKFYRETRTSFVDIHIPNTRKSIYHNATERGYRVTLHKDIDDIHGEIIILFCNI